MGFAGAVEAGFAGSFVFVLYYFHGKDSALPTKAARALGEAGAAAIP
jgi:hypothetical protein